MSTVQPGALTVSRSLSLAVVPCAFKFSLATSRKSRLKIILISPADSPRMDAALRDFNLANVASGSKAETLTMSKCCPLCPGGFNRSAQHLLILRGEEVCH